ncbi:UNVERIFIED_ORG: hypothetical protein J2W82_006073 [Pseudomonas mohnii]|jgi:hypothetical protein|nr:hypothetical protein [Pseudomonas mohnii]
MKKPSPNPPDTDPASPYESDSNKLNEAAERALDFHCPSTADIKATPRKLCSMFIVNPELDVETLLAHACESLASANVMTLDLADRTEGTSRNSLLGIAQVIMLGELAVNRALVGLNRRSKDRSLRQLLQGDCVFPVSCRRLRSFAVSYRCAATKNSPAPATAASE